MLSHTHIGLKLLFRAGFNVDRYLSRYWARRQTFLDRLPIDGASLFPRSIRLFHPLRWPRAVTTLP